MKNLRKIMYIFLAFVFIIILLICPLSTISGAKDGIVLTSSVIIPTLFPFTVATLYAIKINIFSFLKPIEKFFIKTLGQSTEMFSVMLLSFIGGYPVGSKLINELYKQKKINKTQAHYMLCYCVNAGPAFVVSAVGTLILKSKSLGIALFVSHIFSSLLICFFCSHILRNEPISINSLNEAENYKNAFGNSVSSAIDSIIKISAFVILFSAINEIFADLINNETIKTIMLSLEVTNAVAHTENIYLIAFWLGFSGINIWCQIFSITTDCGVNMKLFVFSRLLHGTLNFLTFNAIVHIFNIKVQTLSNNADIKIPQKFGITEVGISLFVLIVFLIICLENKNRGRKLKEDLI